MALARRRFLGEYKAKQKMATDTTIERPLPHNIEAERSILGAVLLDNHALNAAVQVLRSEDFFLQQHRHIFERMVHLGEKQQVLDGRAST